MEKNNFFTSLEAVGLDSNLLWDLAFETGLIERRRLLKPSDILYALCVGSTSGTVSNNDTAAKIDSDCGVSVSKQAVWKKMGQQCEDFFKRILEHIIIKKIDVQKVREDGCLKGFKRILVQDSTIIRLPQRLFEIFSGVANAHTKVCNARIQGTYDLVCEQFVSFSIDPYGKNDLAAAPELKLEEGDLSLRDRGYLIGNEIQRHYDNRADCIFRYKYGMRIFYSETGKSVDILKILENKNRLDIEVKLSNEHKTVVRFVAAPVSEQTANTRRRKAKKESKNTLSKEYLKLLSWSIYITTIDKETFDYPTVYKIYKLRWRIEVIFKCWKGNMGFADIHNVSKSQLHILLYAKFIMIIIFFHFIFKPCRAIIKEKFNRELSLVKLTHYLVKNQEKINEILAHICKNDNSISLAISALAKYCSYDKRNKLNFQQELDALLH
jgi:hypothetical protein